MSDDTDYIYVYLKNQLENASNNSALYSRRLLEYNIAKDAGIDALKELSLKWNAENREAERRYEQNEEVRNSSSFKFGYVIAIIGIILFFMWLFF